MHPLFDIFNESLNLTGTVSVCDNKIIRHCRNNNGSIVCNSYSSGTAACTEKAKYSVCGTIDSDFKAVIIAGANGTWQKGSTIVTLKASYLETLSVGKRTISIVSDTGTVNTNFTIKSAPVTDEEMNFPQTGDNSHMALWIFLLFVSGARLFGAVAYNRKRKYNR